MIDSREASAALSDIEDLGRRVRQSQMYRRVSSILIVWGIAIFAGYLAMFFAPSAARLIWPVIYVVATAGSIVIATLKVKREGGKTFDMRALGALAAFVAFGYVWSVSIGNFSPRQLGAFWSSFFMLPYVVAGLWLGRAFVAIGLIVTTLTLIGYSLAGDWFNLWMAFVNGGGIMIGGLWMRRG